MRLDAKKTGYKVLSTLVASASILTTFGSSVTPIYAEDSTDTSLTATISGDTSGNMVNTIKTNSTCDGTQQLSGTDAEVFKKITPESDGDIICAKSDGFRTEVTGTSDIKNYHWTAWYKKNVDDEPDTTNDLGNYRGFNVSKVQQWADTNKQGVMDLNGGAFPEIKDYTYPTDTTTSTLDFWGDIAGYYSVLGDPQYKNLHLTAYQQFSYKTKHVVSRTEIIPSTITSSGDNGSGTNGTNGVDTGTPVIITNSPKINCEKGTHSNKKGTKCVKDTTSSKEYICKQVQKKVKVLGKTYTTTFTDCGGGYNIWFDGSVMGYNSISNLDVYALSSNEILGKVLKTETSNDNLVDQSTDEDGATVKTYEDITYSWETQEVKVAECDIASGAYATELGTMPRIALKSGSGSTYTINSTKTTFWKTTPRYWTDGGKLTAKNDSSLPYHFESEETAGTGVNNVNLYSTLSQKDKLYNIIHGFPNITKVPDETTTNKKYPPKQDETCVEVGDDAVCSKKQTPPIETKLDLNDDNPQDYEEVEKNVHLTSSEETQEEIQKGKNNKN